MSQYVPTSSQIATVSGASAKFTNAMISRGLYILCADTDVWYSVGATGVTAAAHTANSHFLAQGARQELMVEDATVGFVAVIQSIAGGYASLSLVERQAP